MRYAIVVLVLLVGTTIGIAQDVPLKDILIDGEGWKPFFKDCKSVGGMAASTEGRIVVTDPKGDKVYVIDGNGKGGNWPANGVGSRGVCWYGWGTAQGIVVCYPEEKKIIRFAGDVSSPSIAELAATSIVRVGKGFYIVVPAEGAVYLIDKDQKPRKGAEDLKEPSGLTLWPDEGTLVVSELHGQYLWTYRVEKDGTLSCKEKYYTLRKPSGNAELTVGTMTVDDAGRLYCATSIGVQIFDPTGRMSGVLSKPSDAPVTHVALGGEKGNTLFIACGNEVFARQIKGKGVPWKEKPK